MNFPDRCVYTSHIEVGGKVWSASLHHTGLGLTKLWANTLILNHSKVDHVHCSISSGENFLFSSRWVKQTCAWSFLDGLEHLSVMAQSSSSSSLLEVGVGLGNWRPSSQLLPVAKLVLMDARRASWAWKHSDCLRSIKQSPNLIKK